MSLKACRILQQCVFAVYFHSVLSRLLCRIKECTPVLDVTSIPCWSAVVYPAKSNERQNCLSILHVQPNNALLRHIIITWSFSIFSDVLSRTFNLR